MTFKLEVNEANAAKIRSWIVDRGGVAIWKSIDLSRPEDQLLTPADNVVKPAYYVENAPTIVDRLSDVGVYPETLYKRVRVALRVSGNGLSMKVTDHSREKVNKVCDQCKEKHGNVHYRNATELDGPGINVYYSGPAEEMK